MVKEMKESVNVADIDFKRTEEFFTNFRVEKIKNIHKRIKENGLHLKSTMKILGTDKENFINQTFKFQLSIYKCNQFNNHQIHQFHQQATQVDHNLCVHL